MAVERIAGPITRTRLRRFALIWGWGAFLLLTGFVLGIGPPVSLQGPGRDEIVQQLLLAGGGLAMLVAWRWEAPAGLLLTLLAMLLGVFAEVEFPLLGALGVTVLFLVPGLVLLSLWASRHRWYVMTGTAALVTVAVALGGVGAIEVHDFYFGPQHPQSQIAAPPPSLITWSWSGAVTPTSIRVNAQVAEEGRTARLAVADEPTFEAPRWSAPQAVTEEANRIVAFAVGELAPDTDYFYAVEVDGELDTVRSGRFSTPSDEAFSFTVALGACARTGSNGAVFDTIRELDPFLFLSLGDMHYGNIETNDRGAFRSVLDTTLSEAAQSSLYRSVPVAYVWDDHDFGGDDSDGSSASAPAAQASYREYAPSYELEDENSAIYHAFTIGRVRFLVTDARSAREGDTMLGARAARVAEAGAARGARYTRADGLGQLGALDRPREGWRRQLGRVRGRARRSRGVHRGERDRGAAGDGLRRCAHARDRRRSEQRLLAQRRRRVPGAARGCPRPARLGDGRALQRRRLPRRGAVRDDEHRGRRRRRSPRRVARL